MKRFYFTYGTEGHPFYGGWTTVEAPTLTDACTLFRMYHPDEIDGLLNCCSVYEESVFHRTRMWADGNFGHRDHEYIVVCRVMVEGK